jgi:hypothetical protein
MTAIHRKTTAAVAPDALFLGFLAVRTPYNRADVSIPRGQFSEDSCADATIGIFFVAFGGTAV